MMTPNLLPFIIANHRNLAHLHSTHFDNEECKKEKNNQTLEIDGGIVQIGRNCKGEVVGQIIGRVDDD